MNVIMTSWVLMVRLSSYAMHAYCTSCTRYCNMYLFGECSLNACANYKLDTFNDYSKDYDLVVLRNVVRLVLYCMLIYLGIVIHFQIKQFDDWLEIYVLTYK